MSKLFNLKETVTLAEAADYLTDELKESVVVADILRFALGKKIVLSIDFVNHARARYGKKVALSDATLRILPNLKKSPLKKVAAHPELADWPKNNREKQDAWLKEHKEAARGDDYILTVLGEFLGDEVLEFEDTIDMIKGVWDLSMLGAESLDIKHALQQEIGGPEVTLTSLGETIVVNEDGKTYAAIMEHFSNNPYADKEKEYPYDEPASYYPMGGIPEDALLVVRTTEIARFVDTLRDPRSDRPLITRERNNLLRIIAGLAKEADIDLGADGAAAQLEAAASPYGGPGEQTIRKSILPTIRKEVL